MLILFSINDKDHKNSNCLLNFSISYLVDSFVGSNWSIQMASAIRSEISFHFYVDN